MGEPSDHVIEPAVHRPDQRRRRLVLLVSPIIVLVACAYVGDALTTSWSDRHPLALVLLNARNRILVLTTNQLDAASYYLAAGGRLLVSDPLFYLVGRWYGDAAIGWVERRSKTFGEQARMYENLFAKAAYPLVFLAPNNLICLFAGASGMRIPAFAVLNVSGTVFRLYLIRRVGEAFESPIDSVLDFFGRYRWQLFAASVAFIALVVWRDRRRGRGEISEILDLEHEIEHELEHELDESTETERGQ